MLIEIIDKDLKGRKVINASLNSFMENRSCQTNLISFFGKSMYFISLRAYTLTVLYAFDLGLLQNILVPSMKACVELPTNGRASESYYPKGYSNTGGWKKIQVKLVITTTLFSILTNDS